MMVASTIGLIWQLDQCSTGQGHVTRTSPQAPPGPYFHNLPQFNAQPDHHIIEPHTLLLSWHPFPDDQREKLETNINPHDGGLISIASGLETASSNAGAPWAKLPITHYIGKTFASPNTNNHITPTLPRGTWPRRTRPKIPYLQSENQNKKGEEYFEERQDHTTECPNERIQYLDCSSRLFEVLDIFVKAASDPILAFFEVFCTQRIPTTLRPQNAIITYLNPVNGNEKAKAYFEENKEKIPTISTHTFSTSMLFTLLEVDHGPLVLVGDLHPSHTTKSQPPHPNANQQSHIPTKMLYLNPPDEIEKAKAYFEENKDKIAECFVEALLRYRNADTYYSKTQHHINMPYLNPENGNEMAKAYFDENKEKIAECFAGCIECVDDVGFFISPTDNLPYSMCSTKHSAIFSLFSSK
ncbi:hypothetical protein F5Y13DRAFT_189394 [Hypoxylon sp. FL1857]|nr:hypothetical protein F5Y13DRAFT_189394 [Hypoxylon sp. FL1857]